MITIINLVTIQSYYDIIAHIPYAVHYIKVTYLFYAWKFVLLKPLPLFSYALKPQVRVSVFSVSSSTGPDGGKESKKTKNGTANASVQEKVSPS